jgi:Phage integrase, N-terminal SAM-like domain
MVVSVGQWRTFGTTRKHRSGRWGAECTHPISLQRVLPGKSFRTKAEALRWLAEAEVDLDRGQLLDPVGTKRSFESYATTWLKGRNDLRPKTQLLYDYLLRIHLLPHLGNAPMAKIDPPAIRHWHSAASSGAHSPVTIAKAYRLLRQTMQAGVDDMLLRSNPCTLKNVAVERSAERATPSSVRSVRGRWFP